MDWMLFWTAAGVVLTVVGFILGCFFKITRQIATVSVKVESLDKALCIVIGKVDIIDQRLSRLEGAFEERGRWESRKS